MSSFTPYSLHLRIISAKDLPAADPNGKSDPYVVIHLDEKILDRTITIPANLNPVWNYQSPTNNISLTADGGFPVLHRNLLLTLKVYDRDIEKK